MEDYEEEKTEHTCYRYEDGSGKVKRNKIKEAQTNVDSDLAAVERNVQEVENKTNYIKNEIVVDLGPRQKVFTKSVKSLKIKWSQYLKKKI